MVRSFFILFPVCLFVYLYVLQLEKLSGFPGARR